MLKKERLMLIIMGLEKLYSPYGGPRHLSTIPVKGSHLFKIAESVFSFYLKLHNLKQVRVFLLEWWTISFVHHKDLIISCGFGFWVEISTNYYFILYMADKASLIFLEKKSKMHPISSSLGNNTFLFGMLYKTKTSEILTIFHVSTIFK